MKWTGRAARRGRRAVAQAAALSGMLAVSGLAAGAASASGSPGSAPSAAALSLTYRCRFPAEYALANRVESGGQVRSDRAMRGAKNSSG